MGWTDLARRLAIGLSLPGLLAGSLLAGAAGREASADVGIVVTVPSCVVDVSDVLGWWKGEDDLEAEIGPDLSGQTAFVDGVVDRAFSFDADSAASASTFPAVSSGLTVETWVRLQDLGQTQGLVSRWAFAGAEGVSAFALVTGANQSLLWLTDETSTRRPVEAVAVVPQLFDGLFHHVAGTWSPAAITLWVDGVEVLTRASPGGVLNAADGTPFRLGATSQPGGPMLLTGALDEPTVWGRALDPGEIVAIHGAGPTGKCAPPAPVTQQAKLLGADGTPGNWFGRSVAVDGATVVVGDCCDDAGATDTGSAYVFTRSGTVWSQEAKLVAADAAAFDDFGFSVAVSGDTAVVGAFKDDDGGANAGSVYMFARTGTTWVQQAKLLAGDPAPQDNFGRAVAISGDTVVVGAFLDDDGGSNAGSAYVFSRVGGLWTQQAKLTAADRASGDGFGISVAIDGDLAVIGADQDDDGGSNSGSAYIFMRTGTSWLQQAKLGAADSGSGDGFGYAVAIAGDLAVIGA